MLFIIYSIIFLYIGRRLGWKLSKQFLYTSKFSLLLCLLWGALIAIIVRILINWQNPHIILAIIFGHLLGAYISIPNFGLFQGSSIPDDVISRHNKITWFPFYNYIIVGIILKLVY